MWGVALYTPHSCLSLTDLDTILDKLHLLIVSEINTVIFVYDRTLIRRKPVFIAEIVWSFEFRIEIVVSLPLTNDKFLSRKRKLKLRIQHKMVSLKVCHSHFI